MVDLYHIKHDLNKSKLGSFIKLLQFAFQFLQLSTGEGSALFLRYLLKCVALVPLKT